MKKINLSGYGDLFSEDGADPRKVRIRAEDHIFRIKDTQEYTIKKIKRDLKWHKEDLKETNKVIKDLKSSKDKNETIQKLIEERKELKKALKDQILIQKDRLNVINETFERNIEQHKRVLESLKSDEKVKIEKPNYIG